MKRTISTSASTLLSLIATLMIISTSAQAQNEWTETESWLNAFHQTVGHQASPAWILEQASEAETVYTSSDGRSFALVLENDFETEKEMLDTMEESILEGNGTQLFATASAEMVDSGTYKICHTGMLEGRPVVITQYCQWNALGLGTTILIVSSYPNSAARPGREVEMLALEVLNFNANDPLVIRDSKN